MNGRTLPVESETDTLKKEVVSLKEENEELKGVIRRLEITIQALQEVNITNVKQRIVPPNLIAKPELNIF